MEVERTHSFDFEYELNLIRLKKLYDNNSNTNEDQNKINYNHIKGNHINNKITTLNGQESDRNFIQRNLR